MLRQESEGKERVVSYGGKTFGRAQRNYSAMQRELLGVILGLKHFALYLRGAKLTLVTDYLSLKWF